MSQVYVCFGCDCTIDKSKIYFYMYIQTGMSNIKNNKIALIETTRYAECKVHTLKIFWNIQEDLKARKQGVYKCYKTTKNNRPCF